MFLFKRADYPEIEREFGQVDLRLRMILETMMLVANRVWGDDVVITRIKEPRESAPGSTHFKQTKPYRHADVALLERGDSEMLRRVINLLFPYGVEGYETIPALDHPGTARHFHVQVKP